MKKRTRCFCDLDGIIPKPKRMFWGFLLKLNILRLFNSNQRK